MRLVLGRCISHYSDEFSKMFRLVELTEVMRQKEDTSVIDLLNQIRVGHIDESSEVMIQSRFIDSEDSDYTTQALHNKLCRKYSSFDTQ